ncbi:hypothetical protein [Streptomyces sp. NPDC047976]|uniref:hypothetical protein n=1 Tax=unclassified Streptomyces TaxID=2593676 RepID=UPI00342E4E30
MSEHRQHRWSRTPPARTPDGSDDRDTARAGDTAGRAADTAPDDGAGGHTAKRQRPGIGREEQARPHRSPHSPRPDRESDDR